MTITAIIKGNYTAKIKLTNNGYAVTVVYNTQDQEDFRSLKFYSSEKSAIKGANKILETF